MQRILLFVLAGIISVSAQDTYRKVRILLNPDQGIEKILQSGISMEGARYEKNNYIEIELSKNEQDLLEEAGFGCDIIIADMEKYYQSRLETRTGEGFGYGSMGGYYTYDEVTSQLNSMISEFPDLVSNIEIIGYSLENRPIRAVKISDNPNAQENEPEILFTALHHAREPESMMTLLYYMWHLLENYGTDGEATYLVNNRQIWFVPVVNPDGYVYNQTTNPSGGGMWRKNRSQNSDGSRGVDLNRNYGFQWGYDNSGSSPTPSSETYRGTSAFSEPATQVLRDFCNAHNFVNGLNYHTYSNLLIYPWAYSESHTPDSTLFVTYAQEMTKENGYTYGTPGQTVGYAVNGDANDWMYGEQSSKAKILTMTPEVGDFSDGFWPATNRIVPLAQENLMPNLYYTHVAGGYPQVTDLSFTNTFNGYPDPGESPGLVMSIQNVGLSAFEQFQVIVSSSSPGITITNNSIDFPALPSQQTIDNSGSPLMFSLSTGIEPGTPITLDYAIQVGGIEIATGQTSFVVGTPAIFFADDAENGSGNFVFSGSWNITSGSAHSGTHSFTDSPTGDYGDNISTAMTSQPIDLSSITAAVLDYQVKWDIESSYDFARLQISTNNGTTWQDLVAAGMDAGSGSGVQSTSMFGYDGVSATWLQESVDISSFTGGNIKIRFLLESDGSVTGDGIYVDDIRIFYYMQADTTAPQVHQVDLMTDPTSGASQYEIQVVASDNQDVSSCRIAWRTGSKYFTVPMTAISDSLYSGYIPGQTIGTTVHYYITVQDNFGNLMLAPENAPAETYQFTVGQVGPAFSLSVDSLQFTAPRGLAPKRIVTIKNPGTEELTVSFTESIQTKSTGIQSSDLSAAPIDIRAMQPKLKHNLAEWIQAHGMPQASSAPGGNSKAVVITDNSGDTNNPGADLLQLAVSRSNVFGLITTSFDLTFAATPDTGVIGIVSIDLDQEFGTGAFPAPFGFNLPVFDLGSEAEIIFDIGGQFLDTLNLGPVAVVVSPQDTSVLGFGTIDINGTVASTDILYSALFGGYAFDESFNLAAEFLSFSSATLPDAAPDFGHGTFGSDIPVSWLSALPTSFNLQPGDSIQLPVQVVTVPEPGNYNLALNFTTNDPNNPQAVLPVAVTVLAPLQPDIYLTETTINDTVGVGWGSFMIGNAGNGDLVYFLSDSTFDGGEWLLLGSPGGILPADSTTDINYSFDLQQMTTVGETYQAQISILSNDPAQRRVDVILSVYVDPASGIDSPASVTPTSLVLEQNYPNPFNPTTTIGFGLPVNGHITMKIYNMLGQQVAMPVNGNYSAGYHRAYWNGRNAAGQKVASGIYIYELNYSGQSLRKKMILMQ